MHQDAQEADSAVTAAKRAHHPDPLRPEQAKELGINGVAKDDNVFLVDKILDERYKNVRVLCLGMLPTMRRASCNT